MSAPRRVSPLASTHPADPTAPAAVAAVAPAPAPALAPAEPATAEPPVPAAQPATRPRTARTAGVRPSGTATGTAGTLAPPVTRSRRRRGGTAAATVTDMDMVAFNCNMTRVARQAVRLYAAEHDVDIQDVVEDALIAYLAARGIPVPRRPEPDSAAAT